MLVNKFRHYSSEARIVQMDSRIKEVSYFGPMTWGTFATLREPVLAASAEADALLIRMDSSLWLMDQAAALPAEQYPDGCPPAAVICRDDTREVSFWKNYTAAVSERGISRLVFRSSQLFAALEWVDASARLWHRARLERQRSMSALCFAPLS